MIYALVFAFSLEISFPTPYEKTPELILEELSRELPSLYVEGRPNFPVKTLSFAVRNFKGIEVIPLWIERFKVKGILPPSIPPQIISLKTAGKTGVFDSLFYREKVFYPETHFKYHLVASETDTTLELQLFPFRYRPGDSLIEYISEFSVIVDGEESKGGTNQPLYIVIAPQSFRNTLAPLLKLRKQKGYFVIFKSLEEIFSEYNGRNNAEKIRNFLKAYAHLKSDKFVLLVGDETLIPIVYLYAFDCQAGIRPDENNIPSDLYYADVDGDYDANGNSIYGEVADSIELYPDFYVGRLPVRDTAELWNYLYKLLCYEVSPDIASLRKAIFIAQILWHIPFTDQSIHKEYIRSKFLPSDFVVTGFYESQGNALKNEIIRSLNEGANVVNHDGHGWYTGMWIGQDYIGIRDVQDLTNIYTPFFLYSIGCWVGAMDYNSLAEELVKARGGALGVVANSRYGWGAPGNPGFGYSDFFDNEFFKLLFKNKDDELGKVFWSHKANFVPLARDTNVYRWCYFEINLFGDPSITPWRGTPKDFVIFSKDINRSSIKLVIGYDGRPLSGVNATLMVGDSVIDMQKSDIAGIVSFNVDTLFDSVLLTLWKPGFNIYWEWLPLRRKDLVFALRVKGSDGPKDWVKTGENNVLFLSIVNQGHSEFVDTIHLASEGIIFNPYRIPVNIQPGESLDFEIHCIVEDSLRSNIVKVVELRSKQERTFLPLKVAWPSVDFISSAFEDSFLLLRFKNSSFMDLEGRVLGVFESRDVAPLRFYEDSIRVSCGNEFTLKTDIPRDKNLQIYFVFNGVYLKFNVSLALGSRVFYSEFEDLTKWSGDTSYFCVADFSGFRGNYLTYKREYAPFPLEAQIYSQRFRLSGKFKLGLWFTYRFPIYGITGVKVSLVKEWFNGGSALRTEIEDIAFLGAGGALDGKSIYGDWALYEFEGDVVNNPDSVRLLITFTKDSSSITFWAIDDIIVESAEENLFNREEISFEEVRILNFPTLVRDRHLRFLLLSKRSEILDVELFDGGGRCIKSYKVALKEGLNEGFLPVNEIKSGIYFIRILNTTKRVVIVK